MAAKAPPPPAPAAAAAAPGGAAGGAAPAARAPRLRTRLFAAQLLLQVPELVCGCGDRRHTDLGAAQAAAKAGEKGDWLVQRLQQLVDLAFRMASGQLEVSEGCGRLRALHGRVGREVLRVLLAKCRCSWTLPVPRALSYAPLRGAALCVCRTTSKGSPLHPLPLPLPRRRCARTACA